MYLLRKYSRRRNNVIAGVRDAKGLEQGLQEGIQQGLQKSIIETLEIRFEAMPVELENSIKSIKDLDVLWTLHRHAVTCGSLYEFEEKLDLTTRY